MKLWAVVFIFLSISLSACLFAGDESWLETGIAHSFLNTDAKQVVISHNFIIELKELPGHIIVTERKVVLALNEKNQTISFLTYKSTLRHLESLHAWKNVGTTHPAELGSDYKFEKPLYSCTFYSDVQEAGFSIPSVMPGTAVAFEAIADVELNYPEYVLSLSRETPLELADIRVNMPVGWNVQHSIKNYLQVPLAFAGENKYQLLLKQIDKIPDDPLRPKSGMTDIEISFQFYKKVNNPLPTWDDLAKDCGSAFHGKTTISDAASNKVDELIKSSATPLDKIKKIAEWVQKYVRYVAIEIGRGGYVPHSAQETFANQFGDCKDKATLLVALLAHIGVKAYPVFCEPRDLGWIDDKFPSQLQFQHAIVAISMPEIDENYEAQIKQDKFLFFDPTDEFTPFGSLPYHLQGTKALFLGVPGKNLVTLPQNPFLKNMKSANGTFNLSSSGNLSGNAKELYYGARAYKELVKLHFKTQEEYRNDFIMSLDEFISPAITDFKVTLPQSSTGPLMIDYNISSDGYAQKIDDVLVFNPILFMRINRNPFSSKERQLPINFDYSYSNTFRYLIQIPSGYILEKGRISKQLTNPHAEYSLEIEQDSAILKVKRVLNIKDYLILLADTKDFISFYHDVFKIETAPIFLIPKK